MREVLEVDNMAGDGEYSLEGGQRIGKVKQNVEGNDDVYSPLTDQFGESRMFFYQF